MHLHIRSLRVRFLTLSALFVGLAALVGVASADEAQAPIQLGEGTHEVTLLHGDRAAAGIAVVAGMAEANLKPVDDTAPDGAWAGRFLGLDLAVSAATEAGQRTLVVRKGDKEIAKVEAPRQEHGSGDQSVQVWPFRAEVEAQGSVWRPVVVYAPARQQIDVRARATTHRFHYADVRFGEDLHKLAFLDANANGTVGDAGDFWVIANPAWQQARGRRGFNTDSMIECDEPIFLAPHMTATLEGVADGKARIVVSKAKDSFSAYLARRSRRVMARYEKRFSEGLKGRIDGMREAGRTVTKTPIAWTHTHDLDAALALAATAEKPLLAVCEADWCTFCKILAYLTYPDAEVAQYVRDNFLPVRVHADFASANLVKELGVQGLPTAVVIDPDGQVVDRIRGFHKPSVYLKALQAAMGRYEGVSMPEAEEAEALPAAGGTPKAPEKGKAGEAPGGAPAAPAAGTPKKAAQPATPLVPARGK